MAALATLQTRLTEAEDALHRLACGARVVRLTGPNGVSTEFNQATSPDLRAYIGQLRNEIAALTETSSGSRVFTVQTSRGLS